MKYVAAYLLATIGGKAEPSKKDIETILGKFRDISRIRHLLTYGIYNFRF